MKKFKIKINGNTYDIEIINIEKNTAEVEVNGTLYKVEIDQELQPTSTPKLVQQRIVPSTDKQKDEEIKSAPATKSTEDGIILSPLPGIVLEIFVNKGDKITRGQKVVVIEAMKMENNIESDITGTVKEINVTKGSTVNIGDPLITLTNIEK